MLLSEPDDDGDDDEDEGGYKSRGPSIRPQCGCILHKENNCLKMKLLALLCLVGESAD